MKKLLLISAIALSGLIANSASAQIHIHIGFGLAPQPVYVEQPAPVVEEQPADDDGDADDFYYLPDVDAYYNVPRQCYYYNDGSSWVSATYLPGAYRDYDWRSARHFEVRASRPYLRDDYYRARFGFRGDERRFDRGYVTAYHEERPFVGEGRGGWRMHEFAEHRRAEERFHGDGFRGDEGFGREDYRRGF